MCVYIYIYIPDTYSTVKTYLRRLLCFKSDNESTNRERQSKDNLAPHNLKTNKAETVHEGYFRTAQ